MKMERKPFSLANYPIMAENRDIEVIMKIHSFILTFILLGCSTVTKKKELSQEELDKLTRHRVRDIRPLLSSDNLQFMGCEAIGKHEYKTDESLNEDFWKQFGIIELRNHDLGERSNVLLLNHSKFGKIHSFEAEYLQCKVVTKIKEVSGVGMCKPSKEKVFTLELKRNYPQNVAREILKNKVEYYGIQNYYISYYFYNFKYSFTKKQYSAKVAFYKCY